MKPASLFGYWADGNHWVQVNPDAPLRADAQPFWVIVRSEHVIPISYLVFARDADHASLRILQALREMRDKGYTPDRREMAFSIHEDKRKLLARLIDALEGTSAEYKVIVQPYDITLLAAKVNWAVNGGIS